jgi:glutathione S-transferase
MGRPVLWQTRTSIFCEKSRWALDYKRIAHVRREIPPLLHPALMLLTGRGATIPVLDVAGASIAGSAAINAELDRRWPDPPLYPADRATRKRASELEGYFDAVGHDVRRVVMDPILAQSPLLTETFLAHRPALERRAFRALAPAVAGVTRRRYRVGGPATERARERIEAAFAKLEATLAGGDHLVADAFTAADLAAAALLAPLVQPEGYPSAAWHRRPFPRELNELRDALATRAGGRWVLETYRRHRTPPAP